MRAAAFVIPALLLSAPLAAQATTPATDHLAVFKQLIGEWEGDAWSMRREGRVEVRQKEWVSTEAGGTMIAVRGLGMRTVEGKEQPVHQAFAVIHHNHDGTGIMMRAFTAEGHWLDPEIVATEQGYTWYMTDPRIGRIKYEMVLDEQGRWVENGYYSRDDGKSWTHFMGMVLTRKP
jgi:hypothetical protein